MSLKITSKTSWKDFSSNELVKMQNILFEKKYLTIYEAAIILQENPRTINKRIQNKTMTASHPFGSKKALIPINAITENLG